MRTDISLHILHRDKFTLNSSPAVKKVLIFPALSLCVLYDYQNKQRFILYTALNGWFLCSDCLLRGRILNYAHSLHYFLTLK